MTDRLSYEVLVVGGGPAGMTTAIYTTRLGHRTAVFEAAGGRHASVSSVHNLFGVSEDVSGEALAKHAVGQFQEYGGSYFYDRVDAVRRTDAEDGGADFVVESDHATVTADRIVLATGFTDRSPHVPGLERFTGRGLHYCLHCDAYTLGDERVFVLGHDDHAATMAMLLLNFTADVDLLLDGHEPTWSEETERQLAAHPVGRIDAPVVGVYAEGRGGDAEDETGDGTNDEPAWLGGLRFDAESGAPDTDPSTADTERAYVGGFAAYGKEYNTDLADALGCELAEDGAIAVDDGFETSVDGVYAVGDVVHGQNQTVVALGDGAKAGIALHTDLRTFPRSLERIDEAEGIDESTVPAAAADLRARMRLVRNRKHHAGLREPPPDR